MPLKGELLASLIEQFWEVALIRMKCWDKAYSTEAMWFNCPRRKYLHYRVDLSDCLKEIQA